MPSSVEAAARMAIPRSGCGTPGAIDGATGSGLSSALRVHPGVSAATRLGLSVGDGDPCVVCAQLGGSDGEDGDPQELVGSRCGTSGVVDGATGYGLSGALRAHPGAAAVTRSGLSVGDGDPCVVCVGAVGVEGTVLGDAIASSGNTGIHSTVSAHLGLQF
jgi:hypothetical protein